MEDWDDFELSDDDDDSNGEMGDEGLLTGIWFVASFKDIFNTS